MTDVENRTCMSLSGYNSGSNSLKIRNIKCDSSEDNADSDLRAFYNKNSYDEFDETLLLRGYLCETKAIHTISAYERVVIMPICNLPCNP